MTYAVTSLIQKYVPNTWCAMPYDREESQVHHYFDVPCSSQEFNKVTKQLCNEGLKPFNLKRLQNIYMFGRYLIRMQQLLCRNPGQNIERQCYVCIKEDDLDTLGIRNVDIRYLGLQQNDFNLYNSPSEAKARNRFEYPVMVICRVAREKQTTTMDCELYPEYVVKYE